MPSYFPEDYQPEERIEEYEARFSQTPPQVGDVEEIEDCHAGVNQQRDRHLMALRKLNP